MAGHEIDRLYLELDQVGCIFNVKTNPRVSTEASGSGDDYDSSWSGDSGGHGAEPKESVLHEFEDYKLVKEPFTCDGTLLRHTRQVRDVATIRAKHTTAASASARAGRVRHISTIEWLLPMSSGKSDRVDWTQCDGCSVLDAAFKAAADVIDERRKKRIIARYEQERKDEEAARHRERAPDLKRRRDASRALAIRALESEAPSGETDLDEFANALRGLKVPQLKALCIANHVGCTGTKPELVLRLTRIKHHGGPGLCPRCRHPRLLFGYELESEEALDADPTSVKCSFVAYPSLARCGYSASWRVGSAPRRHARALADTPDGVLAAADLMSDSEGE